MTNEETNEWMRQRNYFETCETEYLRQRRATTLLLLQSQSAMVANAAQNGYALPYAAGKVAKYARRLSLLDSVLGERLLLAKAAAGVMGLGACA
jgi:hypothetical protein